MSQRLLDVLSPVSNDRNRFYGVAIGVVTDNRDPEKMGRVKLHLPWLSDQDESTWARIAVPMAGAGRGAYFLPEISDEVLVAFEHGDIQAPFVIGALWNGKDAPPASNDDGKNNIRVIHSRSGHLVRLDDTDGDEKIEIIDKTGGNSMTIKASDNSITIACTGKMKLQANGIEITSQSDVKIQASATMDVKSGATMTLQGATVNIN